MPSWPGPADLLRRRSTAIAAILALPVGVAVFWFTETSRPIAALAVVAGFLLSVAVKRAAEWLGHRLTSLRPGWRDAVALKLAGSDGYVDNGTVVPGHLANAGLFATTLVVYAIGYYVLKPNGLFEAPAIAFVLFMLIMLGWFLPAVSFFADKYRVSTVISLAAIPYVLFFINDIDHYYFDAPAAQPEAVAQAPGQTPLTSDLRTAFEARMGRALAQYPDGQPVIIAVAAGGGGGSAALWSVRVLAGLQQQFGARFTDSIEMVSAVSGGSIGTVHFMDAFDTASGDNVPVTPTDARLEAATRGAGRSMLASVAWGLAYPDFWRLFSVPHWNLYVDRGWALEEALDGRLNRRGVRLSQWRNGILSGHRPNVMFNATVSETGDRLVISPVHLGRVSESCRSGRVVDASCDDQIDAYTLSPNSDLRVVAAARLSATFPFVMPIPKPRLREGETPYHIADGGYYDNGGLLTLVEWSRKVLTFPAAAAARKMLIIDIRVPDPVPAARERTGWIYATVGPLLTILNARTTSQVSRNMLDVSLLSNSEARQGVDVELVTFPLKLTTSRAWHLPATEQKAIDSYWKENKEVQSARKQVCGVLKGAGWTNVDCG